MKKLKILILIGLVLIMAGNMACTVFALSGEWGSIVDKSGNGDVNGDNMVNEADLEMIKSHIVGITVLSAAQIKRADADKNGRVDIRDYNIIYAKNQGSLPNN